MPTSLLTYKFVAFAVMLAEINYCATVIKLPTSLPVEPQNLRTVYLPDPRQFDPGGRLDTASHSFSFRQGKLCYIQCLIDDRRELSLLDYDLKIAIVPCILSTNDAYRVARDWLGSLDVDVVRLEKEKPVVITQRAPIGMNKNDPSARTLLPIFDVEWGRYHDIPNKPDPGPAVKVEISGTNGMLLYLRQEDLSYSHRPSSLFTNLECLLRISDEEFGAYSPSQRSNLVAEFAAVEYDGIPISGPRSHVPMAYESVATTAMLAEAGYCVEKLRLPEDLPTTESRLKSRYLVPPQLSRLNGRLETSKYAYNFSHGGRLWQIRKLDPYAGMTHLEATKALKNVKSRINDKQALRIARNWLELLSVDVRELESTNLFRCRQQVWLDPQGGMPKPIPIFDATWGHASIPKVSVCIDGRTRELISLKLEDDSFSRRPRELLRHIDGLLAISDDEFRRLSASERSQLAKRFLAADYVKKPEDR